MAAYLPLVLVEKFIMCISSLTGTTRVPLASNWTTSRSGNLAWASHGTKYAAPLTCSTTIYHTMGSWYPQGINPLPEWFWLVTYATLNKCWTTSRCINWWPHKRSGDLLSRIRSSSIKLHSLATGAELPSEVPLDRNSSLDPSHVLNCAAWLWMHGSLLRPRENTIVSASLGKSRLSSKERKWIRRSN